MEKKTQARTEKNVTLVVSEQVTDQTQAVVGDPVLAYLKDLKADYDAKFKSLAANQADSRRREHRTLRLQNTTLELLKSLKTYVEGEFERVKSMLRVIRKQMWKSFIILTSGSVIQERLGDLIWDFVKEAIKKSIGDEWFQAVGDTVWATIVSGYQLCAEVIHLLPEPCQPITKAAIAFLLIAAALHHTAKVWTPIRQCGFGVVKFIKKLRTSK